jgi:hypothetical protein
MSLVLSDAEKRGESGVRASLHTNGTQIPLALDSSKRRTSAPLRVDSRGQSARQAGRAQGIAGGVVAVRSLPDYEGRAVRLTDERLAHIREHPEMAELEAAIEETLARPARVVQSLSDLQAQLYYRWYVGTAVGDKYLCVVVKVVGNDAFVLTAYLTDTIKKGRQVWPIET